MEEREFSESARRVFSDALVRRLGEAGYGEPGRVGFPEVMAVSGVPVPEGVVLTREFHRRFLETVGLAGAIRDSSARGGASRADIRRRVRALRRRYGRAPIDGGLNRMICEAIVGLGARTVVILSEDVTQTGLRTLPAARDAVCKA